MFCEQKQKIKGGNKVFKILDSVCSCPFFIIKMEDILQSKRCKPIIVLFNYKTFCPVILEILLYNQKSEVRVYPSYMLIYLLSSVKTGEKLTRWFSRSLEMSFKHVGLLQELGCCSLLPSPSCATVLGLAGCSAVLSTEVGACCLSVFWKGNEIVKCFITEMCSSFMLFILHCLCSLRKGGKGKVNLLLCKQGLPLI